MVPLRAVILCQRPSAECLRADPTRGHTLFYWVEPTPYTLSHCPPNQAVPVQLHSTQNHVTQHF